MLTADDSAETAVRAMKLGAADYLTKPFDLEEVKIVVGNVLEKRALKDQVDSLRRMSAEIVERPIIGVSPAIESLKEEVSRLAEAGVNTILITGESGTGKEMFARFAHSAMHGEGEDSYVPFVGINCAAMPENLVESELFGHERGAFTDAKTEKKGLFELAHGGSILLDEIGDMPLFLQSKLLRVLEERQARRIGGRQDIPIEAVVFATTNRDLEQAVDYGTFRRDLFYRLNAFPLHLPPLRERRDDILALARYFLGRFLVKYKRQGPTDFSPEAEARLSAYDWPGNVREVRNVVERIVVLGRGQKVLPEHLPREIAGASASAPPAAAGAAKGFELLLPDEGLSLEDVERQLIEQALAKAGGNKTLAAKLLGMTYDSLRYQIKKFELE
jgi:DNA-binding NtrC family response regulator